MKDAHGFWSTLDAPPRDEIRAAMRVRRIPRGETLIERNSPGETLYVVDFGLFEVRYAKDCAVDEIGADELIGEIGFFAGVPRNASVVAVRDSQVQEIDRATFDALSDRVPKIERAATRALARRLASLAPKAHERVRTARAPGVVVIVGAGSGAVPEAFLATLRRAIEGRVGTLCVTSADLPQCFARGAVESYEIAAWLARIERENDLVVCVVDPELNAWSDMALRAADQVVLVGSGDAGSVNPVETEALALFEKARRRLVLIHERRSGFAEPSARWLERRAALMVHHVCLDVGSDVESLVRFLTGRAVGFVAGGGGAFGPAHVGIFKAFREMGVAFDIYCGSSVGSAFAGAFAMLVDPDEITSALQEMFVRRRALNRVTWPRYALLDHGVFDQELQRLYPGRIEDAWRPYFAIATDLSTFSVNVMREGPLWQAIRASCSIPGVLPPFFDANGHMLVDGGVADNIPLNAIHSLKAGPNLVIDLRPQEHCRYSFDYWSIPPRREWISRAFRPGPWNRPLPQCPGPASVIQRAVFAKIGADPFVLTPQDLVLRPPAFPGSSFMNWDRHQDVLEAAQEWASRTIKGLIERRDPALEAILDAAR